MKAPDFRYERPDTVDAAVALLAAPGDRAQVLAGGQSLMPMLAMRLAAPELLVDINRIAALAGIDDIGGEVRVGAMTRYADLLRWPHLATRLPLLALALPHVAHVAIRNRGTIGGSLALADPAAELPACALALGASIELVSAHGTRIVAAADYFHGLYETARRDDELIAAVRFPAPVADAVFGFHEIARRHGDFALAGAAAAGLRQGGRLAALSVALFGCDDRPVLAVHAAAVVLARGTAPPALAAASEALAKDIQPGGTIHGDAETRLQQAKVAFRRAVAMAGGDG